MRNRTLEQISDVLVWMLVVVMIALVVLLVLAVGMALMGVS